MRTDSGKGRVLKATSDYPWQDNEAERKRTRVDKVRTDIVRRFRVICRDMPEQEFDILVEKMLRQQLRSEGILLS